MSPKEAVDLHGTKIFRNASLESMEKNSQNHPIFWIKILHYRDKHNPKHT